MCTFCWWNPDVHIFWSKSKYGQFLMKSKWAHFSDEILMWTIFLANLNVYIFRPRVSLPCVGDVIPSEEEFCEESERSSAYLLRWKCWGSCQCLSVKVCGNAHMCKCSSVEILICRNAHLWKSVKILICENVYLWKCSSVKMLIYVVVEMLICRNSHMWKCSAVEMCAFFADSWQVSWKLWSSASQAAKWADR